MSERIPNVPPEEMLSQDERAKFEAENKELLENMRMFIDTIADKVIDPGAVERYMKGLDARKGSAIGRAKEEAFLKEADAELSPAVISKEAEELAHESIGLKEAMNAILERAPVSKDGYKMLTRTINREGEAENIDLYTDQFERSFNLRTVRVYKKDMKSYVDVKQWYVNPGEELFQYYEYSGKFRPRGELGLDDFKDLKPRSVTEEDIKDAWENLELIRQYHRAV